MLDYIPNTHINTEKTDLTITMNMDTKNVEIRTKRQKNVKDYLKLLNIYLLLFLFFPLFY